MKTKFTKGEWRQSHREKPNGMYSTGSNSATWVLCLDNKGKIHPAYIEEEVNVFPFKLTENVQQFIEF